MALVALSAVHVTAQCRRKSAEKFAAHREGEAKIKALLENIERYDGTPGGQRVIK